MRKGYQYSKNKKPSWLKIKLPSGDEYRKVRDVVELHGLHTICKSGHCPNMSECWGRGTATFMILGDVCTRNCLYCNVTHGKPLAADIEEPEKVAIAVGLMKLKHVVITSVTRDDLKDRGAENWVRTVQLIKSLEPAPTIEILIPDVMEDWNCLKYMTSGGQEIVSHNLETTRSVFEVARPQGDYNRSLDQIKELKKMGHRTKSGIMVGLGESKSDVLETLGDLRYAGCEIVTIGQYLQPTKNHMKVHRYVHPEEFDYYATEATKMGFEHVESGPLVRSSYRAERQI